VWASGCQLVYPLDNALDPVPHVPAALETPGKIDLLIPANGTEVILDTSPATIEPGPPFEGVDFTITRQTEGDTDIVVIQVDEFRVDGVLKVRGTRPFVVVANKIFINGTLDAGAIGPLPGAGGNAPRTGLPGEGGSGTKAGGLVEGRNHSGGGGGAFGLGSAPGGEIDCGVRSVVGGGGGVPYGDAKLFVLEGGGAGGAGGFDCATVASDGGAGGGALQLSALELISIEGNVLAGGGGGQGGRGGGACSGEDGAGSGGGAGGAIYLDSPSITNTGLIAAMGGGGGGGGSTTADGLDGADARGAMPSIGGVGTGKGTSGGVGATINGAIAGITGTCDVQQAFNTGGGGGSHGRIVFRGTADPVGTVRPTATDLPR
jgi:hypothetical protein